MYGGENKLAGPDIGSGEVRALGEQRLAQRLREGIGEAVSKVEGCRVPAFAVLAPSQTRNFNLLGIHGNDVHLRLVQEEVKFPPGGSAALRYRLLTNYSQTRQ